MSVPGRVEAAISYLRHLEDVRNPGSPFEGMRPEVRDVSAKEAEVEEAALDVMLAYFTCRADFGDVSKQSCGDPKSEKLAVKITESDLNNKKT